MTSQVPLRELSTVELYALWEAELAQMVRPPNIALVAACEVHAESRGVWLQDVVTLLARGEWNAALHPRGKDGKFIEVGGLIRMFKGLFGHKEQRGRVTEIIPGNSPDGHDSKIRVSLFDKAGNDTGKIVDASPDEIEQLVQKGRLDTPGGGGHHDLPGGGNSELDAYRKKLTDATNPDGSPAFSAQEIERHVDSRRADMEFAKQGEAIDSLKNPFPEGDGGGGVPPAPGGEGSSPLTKLDEASLTPDERRRLAAIRDENRDARAEGIPGNEPVNYAPGKVGQMDAPASPYTRDAGAGRDRPPVKYAPGKVGQMDAAFPSPSPRRPRDAGVPEAPGGEQSAPLKAIKEDDLGAPIPFASQFTPAAREARAAGNTEQVAAFTELDDITTANADPPEIRKNMVAKRDEYKANGESEKVKVADFALEAWDNEYKDWKPPEPPGPPPTKEQSDQAIRDRTSEMLKEAGSSTTNLSPADVFTPPAPGGEDNSPQLDLMGVALGGDPNTTLTPEQVDSLAQAIISGNSVDVNPPDLDDVVDKFADRPKGQITDLTLMPPFTEQKKRSKGRTRVQMPQIPAEYEDEWKSELAAKGIDFEMVDVDPFTDLHMTQNELDGTKVGGIMRAAKAGKLDLLGNPLYVSSDGYVLDGHHRWAAAAVLAANCVDPSTGAKKQGKGCPVNIPIVRINLPIDQLLPIGDDFDRARGIETLAVGQSRPGDDTRFVENVPAAPAGAPAIPAAGLAAAGEEGEPVVKKLDPNDIANWPKMARDTDDFEALGMDDDIEEWDRKWKEIRAAKGEPESGTQASLRTASLRARVHGAR